MLIAVAGCVAQAEGAEIMPRAPSVDLVVGPQTYHRLPELIARARAPAAACSRPISRPREIRPSAARPRPAPGVSAFLTVQEGCDKFCTFCVVPYTRGAEYSRPAAQILAEARGSSRRGRARDHAAGPERQRLSRRGARRREWGLGDLMRALAEIAGLARIRYTTCHPRDIDDG